MTTTAKSMVMKPLFRSRTETKQKGKGSYDRKKKHRSKNEYSGL